MAVTRFDVLAPKTSYITSTLCEVAVSDARPSIRKNKTLIQYILAVFIKAGVVLSRIAAFDGKFEHALFI